MARKTNNRYICKRYDNIAEFDRYLESGTTQPAFVEHGESSFRGSAEFTGTESYEAANDLLRYGDRELAAKIEQAGVAKVRARIRANAQTIKMRANVVGFMPHVPNFVAGVPTSMIDAQRMERRGRAINIVYNMSVLCDVSAESLIQASCNVLAAAMMVEASGERLNLYTSDITRARGKKEQTFAAFVRVKSSDQRMDVLRCAYPMASPAMERRHFFRFTEVTEGILDIVADGYGRPVRDGDEIATACKEAGIRDAIVINYYDAVGKTIDELAKMMTHGR